jgi:hypothetical protein
MRVIHLVDSAAHSDEKDIIDFRLKRDISTLVDSGLLHLAANLNYTLFQRVHWLTEFPITIHFTERK